MKLKKIPRILVFFLFLGLSPSLGAKEYQRIVILEPSAVDVILKLGLADRAVGRTRGVTELPGAVSVGSRMSPSEETILSLRPDLLILSSSKSVRLNQTLFKGVDSFLYTTPSSLEDILDLVRGLGQITGRKKRAEELIKEAKEKLASLPPLKRPPLVICEAVDQPYRVKGQDSFSSALIEAAGGTNGVPVQGNYVAYSEEKVLQIKPQVYILISGGMNPKPSAPLERPVFRNLQADLLTVSYEDFTRFNLNSFDVVVSLNEKFHLLGY